MVELLVVLTAAVIVAGVSAGTAFALNHAAAHRQGDDAVFWYGFLGITALVCAVVWVAVAAPMWAAAAVLFTAVCTGAASWWLARGQRRRRAKLHSSLTESRWRELEKRHDGVLARWSGYELDPAQAIDYPQLSDVRVPETAAAVRAMKTAARLRNRHGDRGAYANAVVGLEEAFGRAEASAQS